ncbi:zona pellucida-like domain protein [Teladorsagia circumcincta]|uniref:Zona pellucida-like domain protein n=1 Tax=Teladorsagia circumcincta TaxID=45464 RepID=A0A2G9UPC8_TELCI|nr:zona pellucida-like domain protein [Teladorsagia circumcincta]
MDNNDVVDIFNFCINECVSNKSVDLLLVLDGSGSIGDDTFRNQIAFAMHLAQRMNISSEGSRMAIIQYAETPRLEFALNQYTHPTQLEWAIQRINFLSGATNTGQALKLALDRGFDGARGGDIPKVAVVVTDGQSQDEVSEQAQLLRDAHIMLYAIGVTNLVNVHQLHQCNAFKFTFPITGNPVRVFTVESFEQLDKSLADSLTWDMCKTEFRPGTPDIICGPDRVGVRASTKKPFDGYVFVMDHFHQEECRAGPEKFSDPRSIGITVPFNACNVHRYRSLNPRGIFVEMTVVFMFHTLFMTKVDQMVKIQCFYMEADKKVTVPLSVSMITTQFREKVYQMPQCSYTLRKGSPDGDIVRYATLGESVFHRWECIEVEKKDTFGMLVHSCYVDNGFGDRVDILGPKGCGLDAVLLSTPEYDSSLRLATKAYHVFKYADRPVLQFQCQITLCLKYDGGCDGITPPKDCPSLPGEDGHHHHHGRRRKAREARAPDGVGTVDVFTESVTVVDHLPSCSTSVSCEVVDPHLASTTG